MFSVNIDKLVSMTPKEESAYRELCNHVLAKGRKFKTLAVIGAGGISLKFAEAVRKADNKVLFIDADFSSSVFINKYKLGKNLKGICDYLAGIEAPENLKCLTNKADMNIIFTGDTATHSVLNPDPEAFGKLLNSYREDYDYVIIEAANDSKIAAKCDGTLYVMDNSEYSEKKAKKEVERLADEGCLVLGTVISNS